MKPVYLVTSSLIGQRQKMDAVADNVANINTPGYKRLKMDFRELVAEKGNVEVGSFALHRGTRFDMENGAFQQTNSPLDIAIGGNGYYPIDVNGQVQYTRNGHFQLDAGGQIITDKGYPLLDFNGGPIVVPAESTFINVAKDGTLSNQFGAFGNIGVFQFDDPQMLLRAGNAYIANGQEAVLAPDVQVRQGFLEASNVNPVEETVQMTSVLRAYQSALNVVQSLEETEQRAVRQLSVMP